MKRYLVGTLIQKTHGEAFNPAIRVVQQCNVTVFTDLQEAKEHLVNLCKLSPNTTYYLMETKLEATSRVPEPDITML